MTEQCALCKTAVGVLSAGLSKELRDSSTPAQGVAADFTAAGDGSKCTDPSHCCGRMKPAATGRLHNHTHHTYPHHTRLLSQRHVHS